MKGFLQRLIKTLRLDGRDWVVFLTSLLLACSIWFIHNLSLKYSDIVEVPVRVTCNLEGHSDRSSNSQVVAARCRMTGYNLVRARAFARKGERNVTFAREAMHPRTADSWYVTGKELQEVAHIIFGESATLEYFLSDTLVFTFPRQECRRVPVRLYADFQMRPQYMMAGDVVIEPDSVTVYGEPSQLEKISSITTEKFYKKDISSGFSGVLKLRKPSKGLRLSDESVRFSASVSRFVEISRTLPVEVINAPLDKEFIVIPSSVNASFRCAFPYSSDPLESAGACIDYNDYRESRSGKCQVKSRNVGEAIIDCSFSPAVVECVER